MSDDIAPRGLKRKRPGAKQIDMETKLARKLHHELREARKVTRKAKTFETQKLVKKLKQLRQSQKSDNDQEILSTELQLEALKHVNLDTLAKTALRSKLKKDHALSHDDCFQAAMSKEFANVELLVPGSSGEHTTKVESRLLSSKIIAAEMGRISASLRSAIVPEQPEENAQNYHNVDEEEASVPGPTKKPKTARSESQGKVVAKTRTESLSAGSEEDAEDAGWESGTVDEAVEGVEDGWESGSVSQDDPDDDSDVDSEPPLSDNEGPSCEVKAPKKPAASSAANSTFLPSLSVGFIRGSDDSDFSEGEAKAAEIEPKKNRRGQRARRAIWEKKYGKNANHKKNEPQDAHASRRQSRSAPDRAHKANSSHPYPESSGHSQPRKQLKIQPQGSSSARASLQAPVAAGTSGQASAQQTTAIARSLHPSWEAKRKQREIQSAGIVQSAAKKIVFS